MAKCFICGEEYRHDENCPNLVRDHEAMMAAGFELKEALRPNINAAVGNTPQVESALASLVTDLKELLREAADNQRAVLKNGLEPWIARLIEENLRKVDALGGGEKKTCVFCGRELTDKGYCTGGYSECPTPDQPAEEAPGA